MMNFNNSTFNVFFGNFVNSFNSSAVGNVRSVNTRSNGNGYNFGGYGRAVGHQARSYQAPISYLPAPMPSYTPTPSYSPAPTPSYGGYKPYKPPVYNTPAPPPYNPPAPPPYNPPAPPPYNPPAPPPYNPPTPPPPPTPKVRGSAGLFGDPQFGLFTPNVNAPALRNFQSNIGNGQTVTLLNDANSGGLDVKATGIQVDPTNANTTGVGRFVISSGSEQLIANNNGTFSVGDQAFTMDLLKQHGTITMASGAQVFVAARPDGANGQMADRLVFRNGEYEITAALRSPHPDSANYFDMNFEELTTTAADNATGYRTSVAGLTQQFGIADLLRLEPGGIIA